MKEVTMIATCELTEIVQVPDETIVPPVGFVPPYEEYAKAWKQDLGLDDVNVKSVQFFVRDLPNQ